MLNFLNLRLFASALIGLAILSWPQIVPAAPVNDSTGISNPQNVVTFEEIVLPVDTPMTDQYAFLGLTFSGLFYEL